MKKMKKMKKSKKCKKMKMHNFLDGLGFLNLEKINQKIAKLEPLYTIDEELIDVLAFGDDKPGYEHWFLLDVYGKKHLFLNVYTADQLKEL